MTIGRIIFILIGSLILGIISGLITKNIFVGIAFPFLLIAFLLMWNSVKKEIPKEEEKKEIKDETTPPISTNYPPTTPTRLP